jgi:ATP/maltotriose-dependent transcriptional regulator MalT
MAAYQAAQRDRAWRAFEEALELAAELREVPHIAAARFMLAQLAILEGEPARAREHARAGLAHYSELEDDRSRARCIVVLAGAAAAEGELDDAARLMGAAGALRGDEQLDAFEQPVVDLHLSALPAALGDERFRQLEREGAGLGRAVHLAEVVSAATEE